MVDGGWWLAARHPRIEYLPRRTAVCITLLHRRLRAISKAAERIIDIGVS